MPRAISFITMIFISAVGPYWLFPLYLIFFAILFAKWNEGIFLAFFLDSLYGRPILHFSFWLTLFAIVIIFVVEKFKKNLI